MLLIMPCKDMKEGFQNASESAKDDGVSMFRSRGRNLGETEGNVSFTTIRF